jgi:hypothetical protein
VLEALRNLIKEVLAILSLLRPADAEVSEAIIERVQELCLSWVAAVRPGLAVVGVPPEVLARTDDLTSKLAQVSTTSMTRDEVLPALAAVRRVLYEQVLLEVAKIPPTLLDATPPPPPAALFPEISDLPNQLVPYPLQGWSGNINKFLEKNPFDKNCFVMVSYRKRLEPLIKAVKEKLLVGLELNPIVARDHALTNDLYNPIACLLCCNYGVAIFDRAETAQMHNPNVVYELGMMQLLKRRCVILKHRNLRKMPTDLLSTLYEEYSSCEEAVIKLAAWWAKNSS